MRRFPVPVNLLCQMSLTLSAFEDDVTKSVLRRAVGRGRQLLGALLDCGDGFSFAFPAVFAIQGGADWAFHKGGSSF